MAGEGGGQEEARQKSPFKDRVVAGSTTGAALQLWGVAAARTALTTPEQAAHGIGTQSQEYRMLSKVVTGHFFFFFLLTLKKKENLAPSMWVVSLKKEINDEMSSGKQIYGFSLLPSPESWPVKEPQSGPCGSPLLPAGWSTATQGSPGSLASAGVAQS